MVVQLVTHLEMKSLCFVMIQISWTNHQVSSAIASESLSSIWQSDIVLIKIIYRNIESIWNRIIFNHCKSHPPALDESDLGPLRWQEIKSARSSTRFSLRSFFDFTGIVLEASLAWGSHYLQLWQKSWSALWQQQQPDIVENKGVKMYLVYNIYQTLRQK